MSDTAITDRMVERHDTARDLAAVGIHDESLREHIINVLVEERTAHYEPESGYYRFDAGDLDRLIDVAITETTSRVAETLTDHRDNLDLTGTYARGLRDMLTEAARIARTVGGAA